MEDKLDSTEDDDSSSEDEALNSLPSEDDESENEDLDPGHCSSEDDESEDLDWAEDTTNTSEVNNHKDYIAKGKAKLD